MKKGNSSNKKAYAGFAILTAVAASLCCITPVLVFVAGVGGVASAFSWLEPFRPYFIGLTVAVLAFAWYQKLKPGNNVDCDCENEKMPVLRTKTFLGGVTVFAGLMLAFPNYAHIFYPSAETRNIQADLDILRTAEFHIRGMTCTGCEEHIKHAINELDGIQFVDAHYETGKTTVQFDHTRTDRDKITAAINATGYQVTD